MARLENPPFGRGETFYGGATPDSTNLGGENLRGKEWVFEDVDPDSHAARSGNYVRCRIVRNVAGIALLPKRLVTFKQDDDFGKEIDGYATTTAQECYPLDEYLPTAGVVDDDLCWVVMEGPATVLTSIANMSADVDQGDWVVALTAATSQATTAGRIAPFAVAAATTSDHSETADMIMGRIGRALTAKTTTGTNDDILIHVGKF